MRVAFGLISSVLVVNVFLLWWSWTTSAQGLRRLIPEDILALAIVDDPDRNLELLLQNPLKEWLEVSGPDRLEPIGAHLRTGLEGLLTVPLTRAVLLLHQLEHRQESTFKLHFSLILQAPAFESRAIDDQLNDLETRLFGSDDFEVERRGHERFYRGQEPRHLLYYRGFSNLHAVSNSQAGWKSLVRTWNFRQNRLFAGQDYLKIRQRLPSRSGVFLYCDGSRILSPLPKFGYRVWREDGTIRDAFHALDP